MVVVPHEVIAGPHRGKYVLPERVMFADEFEAWRDASRMLSVVSLDIDEAWSLEQGKSNAPLRNFGLPRARDTGHYHFRG